MKTLMTLAMQKKIKYKRISIDLRGKKRVKIEC